MQFVLIFIIFLPLFANDKVDKIFEPLQPIFQDDTLNKSKIKLGEKLFFDKKLSKDDTISCGTCHKLELAGVDNLEKSFGVDGKIGAMNTPTVLNSRYNFVQFWDGRVNSLEKQIDGPLHNPAEMATNWKDVLFKLNKDSHYKKIFDKLFEDGITEANIKNAIVEYEKSLITPSRFDKYLLGDNNILSQKEKEGYRLFKTYGCSSCHQGKNIGGNFYEKLGVFKKYPQDDKKENFGRYNILKTEDSKFEFKVPTLRNIEKTYPYLHDGSIKKLSKVIQIMGEYQLGRSIPKEDILKIESFLKTLTWEKLEKSQNGN